MLYYTTYTFLLIDTRVGVEYGTVIMRCRNEKGWTQRDLAQVCMLCMLYVVLQKFEFYRKPSHVCIRMYTQCLHTYK